MIRVAKRDETVSISSSRTDLQGGLDGFGTGNCQQNTGVLIWGQQRKVFKQSFSGRGLDVPTGMQQLCSLLLNSIHHTRMLVAKIHGTTAGRCIEVTVTMNIIQPTAIRRVDNE